MKRLLSAVLLLCAYASAQQINPNQIQPGTNGYVLTTVDGVAVWAPGGGAGCPGGCVLLNPTLSQTVLQPSGTQFNVTTTGGSGANIDLITGTSGSLNLISAGGASFSNDDPSTGLSIQNEGGGQMSISQAGAPLNIIAGDGLNIIASGGSINLSGASSGACANGLALDSSSDLITIACPGAAGVTSINTTAGAFTFSFSSGAGSCSGTTCTFTGSGSGGGSVTNVIAGTLPSWLSLAIATSTTTPTLNFTASAIPNASLANDSITINSTSCTLGGSCSVGGTPGGSSGALQYNNASAFGGIFGTGFVYANGSSAPTIVSSIPYSDLAALSANQVLGALTATTPGGLSMPSCSGTANALTWVTGTGFGCNTISGGGGGGPTIETNGVSNTTQSLLNFVNPPSFSGLSFAFSNTSGGIETFGVTGTLNNAGLANSSIKLGTTSISLGATATSAAGFNAATATDLAATPSQCASGLFATGIAASGNANCATPAGGGNVSTSGTTSAGYYPVLNGGATITNGHLDDGVTTASTVTSSETIAVNDGTGQGGTFNATEGTAASAASGHDILYADSTAHCLEYSANGGSFACLGSGSMTYPGAGIANSTGSAWGTSYTVGNSGADIPQLSSGLLAASVLPLGSSSAFGAVKVDGTSITASGGVISASGSGGSNSPQYMVLPNYPTGGTGLNLLASWQNSSGSPYGIITTPVPTSSGSNTGLPIVGVCIANCGTSGNGTFQFGGAVSWICDNQTVVGDWVQPSITTAGECNNPSGINVPGVNENPEHNTSIGVVLVANSGSGTASTIVLMPYYGYSQDSVGGASDGQGFIIGNYGSPFYSGSYWGQVPTTFALAGNAPINLYQGSRNGYFILDPTGTGAGGGGVANRDFLIDTLTSSNFGFGMLRVNGSLYNVPNIANVSGTITTLSSGNGMSGVTGLFIWTLTGNATLSAPIWDNPGHISTFDVVQAASGGPYTFTWPGSFLNAPTISTTASAPTIASFLYDGTNWNCIAGCATSGGGGGIDVNGSAVSGTANLNGTTPAAPATGSSIGLNTIWQVSSSSVSSYVPNLYSNSSTNSMMFVGGTSNADLTDLYNTFMGWRAFDGSGSAGTSAQNATFGAFSLYNEDDDVNTDDSVFGYKADYDGDGGIENSIFGSQNQVNCGHVNNVTSMGYDIPCLASNTAQFGNSSTVNTTLEGTISIVSSAPTASAGSVASGSTNASGAITGLSAATTVTITFANSGWPTDAFCVAISNQASTQPYLGSISKTAVTFDFVALTGSLYYHCGGN